MARSFQRPLPPPEPGANAIGPLPGAVIVLALGLAAVEGVLALGQWGLLGGPEAIGWRAALVDRFAVSPRVLDYAMRGVDPSLWLRFAFYPVVHGGPLHAAFAAALLLALGKFVAEGIGSFGMLGVLAAGTLGGALLFAALAPEMAPLYGAYPGIYGLIGGFTYLLWLRLGRQGGNRLAAFRLIGMLMAVQLVFGMLFGSNPQWIGDVGGFLAGLAVAPLLAPGGLAALRARLRER
ncbi:putative membrane protein [Rubellimicrobium thermophilum DSM 16684]|uniref:Putative membrane protein n=1 Tax=Rubellimicrobium thermophilum DSM 16684 TaxID=1123069 RepID=S9QYR2_9RHOB|nr:rhomboid family intramembrane serine protease [Rubellimicrobium thermophilum]EPX84727.1 putative membrane protein [Rubellimicrobium thermophilum DSM 16684]